MIALAVLYLLSVPILWVLYLAIMALSTARRAGKLPAAAKRCAYPLLAVGYLWDFLVNVLVCTPLFVELPREALVTSRVSRHKRAGSGWRYSIANWMCKNLLDPFDPKGCHCN
jgi:hypothetical protein